ncbi:type VII toxin-antitoxin system MntA family adenylyltransferase antitoxin [Natronosalvus halobius]|uniref:type VII toxin-antitoxin system MntA family adenylyltransferase antitoxin n=1 Tax=Natronosalvus halobius TaxID=2953746 RepID=UPI00209CFCF2|nr:nucleotidyltransferase domain-containing protein [Natronosalvus halobius]USZ71393.1 nucleotidyltransferase domain-containing protein [Natronosalvus halobius]
MRDRARDPDDVLAADVDLEGVRSVLEASDVRYAVVFGSYATGSNTSTSDLDVCLRFADECSRRDRFRQRNRIDSTIQSHATSFVDVSDFETLPETVALNALQNGILVYGDEEAKSVDERRLEQRLADTAEQRERQQREFIDRLARGDI